MRTHWPIATDATSEDPLLDAVDSGHADAIRTSCAELGLRLNADDAVALAALLNSWPDPNAAAERLVANRFRGARLARIPETRRRRELPASVAAFLRRRRL